MSTELATEQFCLQLISGIELWMNAEQKNNVEAVLTGDNKSAFIRFDGRLINTSSIAGIFPAADLEATKRRKNGQWTCKAGEWHDKGQTCNHKSKEREEAEKKFYNEHGYYPL